MANRKSHLPGLLNSLNSTLFIEHFKKTAVENKLLYINSHKNINIKQWGGKNKNKNKHRVSCWVKSQEIKMGFKTSFLKKNSLIECAVWVPYMAGDWTMNQDPVFFSPKFQGLSVLPLQLCVGYDSGSFENLCHV